MAITTADGSRVLLVDDQRHLARRLTSVLASQGYRVHTVAECETALDRLVQWRPGLIIANLSQPSVDSLRFLRSVRAESTVPIIVLSARDEEKSKVDTLDSGADDYISIPFAMGELLARVRAALRRSGRQAGHVSFETGDFRVDMERYRVHVREQPVRLTPKELELFVYLARHPNRVVGHRTLLGAVWGDTSLEQPQYLHVLVGQLRKKLEPNPSLPRYLVTEPFVGYRLDPHGSDRRDGMAAGPRPPDASNASDAVRRHCPPAGTAANISAVPPPVGEAP